MFFAVDMDRWACSQCLTLCLVRSPENSTSGVKWYYFWGTQGTSQASAVSLPMQMGYVSYLDTSLAMVINRLVLRISPERQRLPCLSPKISWDLLISLQPSPLGVLLPHFHKKKKVRKLVCDHRANKRQCRNLSPGIPRSRAHAFNYPVNTCSCCLSNSDVVRLKCYKCRQSELHTTKVVIVMIFIKVDLLFKYENTEGNNLLDRRGNIECELER